MLETMAVVCLTIQLNTQVLVCAECNQVKYGSIDSCLQTIKQRYENNKRMIHSEIAKDNNGVIQPTSSYDKFYNDSTPEDLTSLYNEIKL